MSSIAPLSVLIVGCGNIAGGFDIQKPESTPPCTHAGAYTSDDRFIIVACVDPNEKKRKKFQDYWGISTGFSSLEEVIKEQLSFDIISICSPTSQHKKDTLNSIMLKPKLIFCEKPITTSVKETEEIITHCKSANIYLAVNYNRRWDPSVTRLKQSIASNEHGILRSVISYYNKGILNNGSHMIDLLNYLFEKLTLLTVLPKVCDYDKNDPSIPGVLLTEKNIPIHLVTGNSNDYALFELQLVFSEKIITMHEGGLYWSERCSVESKRFAGYKVLDKNNYHEGDYELSMQKAVNNIYDKVENNAPLLSNGENALAAQILCEKLLLIAEQGECKYV